MELPRTYTAAPKKTFSEENARLAIVTCSRNFYKAMLLRVQLEVRQQNRHVLHELQQLRHEVRVVSERLDETEPLDKTRAVSQPALSTVPPVLPRLPANNIKELEAAVRDEAVAATLPSDIFDVREPPRSAVDPFAGRVKPHAPVGAATQLSSMPFTGPLGSGVRIEEQAQVGPSQTAGPGTEQTPLNTAAAQLLEVLMEAARSQRSALKGDLQSPQPGVPSSLRVHLPE
ncbi:hypothetical protein HPB49_010439 [Dermacentor silvarum]|uniref:Uncharacterized protein n=1 Tax=Dermacentor silvarum TaxID=543639 RepID=A0ACB8CEP0_DERSI|nr:hypothetical protein HPB49_010439 [Dermacentor silvarum]